MPSGLYVLGTQGSGRRNLMTCNWATQVAVDPKLVAVSVEAAALSHALLAGRPGLFPQHPAPDGAGDRPQVRQAARRRRRPRAAGRVRPAAGRTPGHRSWPTPRRWLECELRHQLDVRQPHPVRRRGGRLRRRDPDEARGVAHGGHPDELRRLTAAIPGGRGSVTARRTKEGRVEPLVVTGAAALDSLIERLLLADRYALDTEFHRERTYWPRLALLQVAWPAGPAGPAGVALVDPLAVDVAPLAKVLAGPGTMVAHAAEQDLEVLERACGRGPKRLFDTQVAAGFRRSRLVQPGRPLAGLPRADDRQGRSSHRLAAPAPDRLAAGLRRRRRGEPPGPGRRHRGRSWTPRAGAAGPRRSARPLLARPARAVRPGPLLVEAPRRPAAAGRVAAAWPRRWRPGENDGPRWSTSRSARCCPTWPCRPSPTGPRRRWTRCSICGAWRAGGCDRRGRRASGRGAEGSGPAGRPTCSLPPADDVPKEFRGRGGPAASPGWPSWRATSAWTPPCSRPGAIWPPICAAIPTRGWRRGGGPPWWPSRSTPWWKAGPPWRSTAAAHLVLEERSRRPLIGAGEAPRWR